MRREKAFSKDGFYMFVLEANIMLHRNVSQYGKEVLSEWLSQRKIDQPVKLLDLACGGSPVSVSAMMEGCSEYEFRYTGIDINPDQIAAANEFPFPKNVVQVDLIEGNAWELANLKDRFDVIFTGMNLHHGTPEEINCLFSQCKERLIEGGLFINHDFYRPPGTPYLRRPQVNPLDSNESFAMISEETLKAFPSLKRHIEESQICSNENWKRDFLENYQNVLRNNGGDEDGIQEVVAHVSGRDYPLSVEEVSSVAELSGFDLKHVDLHAVTEPLGSFFCLVAGTSKPI
jgi:SAM-dependent methyltransferase